jgi:hypothetical protein
VAVDVRWTLAATDGCVDRYVPSGVVASQWAGPCSVVREPASDVIEPGDGELVVDRSTAPATFRITGASTYPVVVTGGTCGDEPSDEPHDVGGRWADSSGSFDGDVIGGSTHFGGGFALRWDLRRVAAVFTPPGPECSEPSSSEWRSASRWLGNVATVTWSRVSTEGCVDHYAPTGTIEVPPRTEWHGEPVWCSYEPDHAAIVGDELDVLVIDRSTDPASFELVGTSWFEATRRCTAPDGTTWETPDSTVGGAWASAMGTFDGDSFGASYDVDALSSRWTGTWELERVQ